MTDNITSLYERQPRIKFPLRLLIYNDVSYPFRTHWHEGIEIHYIVEGNATLQLNGKSTHVLHTGDCAIINEKEIHHGIAGKCSYYCLIFSQKFFEFKGVSFQTVINDPEVTKMILDIIENYIDGDVSRLLKVQGYSYLLFSHLAKHYITEQPVENLYFKHSDKLNRINIAVEYINNNYNKDISSSSLAEMLHLSEGYFSHLFRSTLGMTATSYITGVRLANAGKLLAKTQMSVTDIAFQCGFSDANYFSRVFKKEIGISPLEHRKKHLLSRAEVSILLDE